MAVRTLSKSEVFHFFSVPKEDRDSDWETALILRLKKNIKQIARSSYNGYNGSKKDILSLEDFESMAYLGLLKAIREYEPSLGSFHNYSSVCIQNAIKQGLIDKRGREEYLVISLREVPEIVTDGGVDDALDMVFSASISEYILTRFEQLLTKREFTVLYKLFASGNGQKSNSAVAKELGTTRGTVELAKRRAIKKIKRCMGSSMDDWRY